MVFLMAKWTAVKHFNFAATYFISQIAKGGLFCEYLIWRLKTIMYLTCIVSSISLGFCFLFLRIYSSHKICKPVHLAKLSGLTVWLRANLHDTFRKLFFFSLFFTLTSLAATYRSRPLNQKFAKYLSRDTETGRVYSVI